MAKIKEFYCENHSVVPSSISTGRTVSLNEKLCLSVGLSVLYHARNMDFSDVNDAENSAELLCYLER